MEKLSSKELKTRFTALIPNAIDLAQLTGDEISLDPITLGLGQTSIEKFSSQKKGEIGQAIWQFFDLPKGKALLQENLVEEITSPKSSTASAKLLRQRTFQTGRENIHLHELLFADGQKRFIVSTVS